MSLSVGLKLCFKTLKAWIFLHNHEFLDKNKKKYSEQTNLGVVRTSIAFSTKI